MKKRFCEEVERRNVGEWKLEGRYKNERETV
jgi:hypothetical protein